MRFPRFCTGKSLSLPKGWTFAHTDPTAEVCYHLHASHHCKNYQTKCLWKPSLRLLFSHPQVVNNVLWFYLQSYLAFHFYLQQMNRNALKAEHSCVHLGGLLITSYSVNKVNLSNSKNKTHKLPQSKKFSKRFHYLIWRAQMCFCFLFSHSMVPITEINSST